MRILKFLLALLILAGAIVLASLLWWVFNDLIWQYAV